MTGDHPVRTLFRLTFAVSWSKFSRPTVLAHSYLTMASSVFQGPKRLPATQTARKRWPPELKTLHRVHRMCSTYCEIFRPGEHRFSRQTTVARPRTTHFRPFGPIWGKKQKRPFGDLKMGDACGFWGLFCSNVNFFWPPQCILCRENIFGSNETSARCVDSILARGFPQSTCHENLHNLSPLTKLHTAKPTNHPMGRLPLVPSSLAVSRFEKPRRGVRVTTSQGWGDHVAGLG
jgi:hypothetical protein